MLVGRSLRPSTRLLAATAALSLSLPLGAALAAGPTAVLHVGPIASQDLPARPGSEPDTLVEPDVAASPVHPGTALAVAHDGRYPDGGAVGIAYAFTRDGGATWEAHPLPGITAATGGPAVWQRASDPVAAYGPDGTAYVSTLLFNNGCDSAVAVSRSADGGRTFAAPVLAHRSASCDVSDDKNWLVVDSSPTSPHRGRIYQFWTPFLSSMFGPDGSPQAMVFSDDHGRNWSLPLSVSRPHANTQNSQPMLLPDGTIVDAYLDYGRFAAQDGPEAADARHGDRLAAAPDARFGPVFTTRISSDGGFTWRDGGDITRDLGGAAGFRCCLPSATSDPVDGTMYAVWNATDATKVKLSSSTDGVHWSTPRVVDTGAGPRPSVNADVSAYDGVVAVSYGLVNADPGRGHFGQQYVVTVRSGSPQAPIAVGPRINYAYAAFARGIFPGDYIGTAMVKGRLYAVWCVSRPVPSGARYHQVLYAATLGV